LAENIFWVSFFKILTALIANQGFLRYSPKFNRGTASHELRMAQISRTVLKLVTSIFMLKIPNPGQTRGFSGNNSPKEEVKVLLTSKAPLCIKSHRLKYTDSQFRPSRFSGARFQEMNEVNKLSELKNENIACLWERHSDDRPVVNFTMLGVSLNLVNCPNFGFYGWCGFGSLQWGGGSISEYSRKLINPSS
jgi:hypothetical protein